LLRDFWNSCTVPKDTLIKLWWGRAESVDACAATFYMRRSFSTPSLLNDALIKLWWGRAESVDACAATFYMRRSFSTPSLLNDDDDFVSSLLIERASKIN
jgi:hypothetical protein